MALRAFPHPVVDMALACERLGIASDDVAERSRVARLLGLPWDLTRPAPSQTDLGSQEQREAPTPRDQLRQEVSEPARPEVPTPSLPATSVRPPSAVPTQTIAARATSLRPLDPDPPSRLPRVEPLPATPAATKRPPGSIAPLLGPRWHRALLSAALATWRSDDVIDVHRAVQSIARAEVIRTPLRRRTTLSRGAQVLLDRADAMVPFFEDQRTLLIQLERVVGLDRLEVLRFERNPRQSGAGRRVTWEAYKPPPAGTPVLLVTDLGIGRPPESHMLPEADWDGFAAQLEAAGCPGVVLVPYPAHRWPVGLDERLTLLEWDRTTDISAVRRALGKVKRRNNGR